MNLNALKPVGPHIEGFVRFAHEGEGDDFKQLDHFEVLGRAHGHAVSETTVVAPRLKPHAIAGQLQKAEEKLRAIPVKLVFDKPENNLSAKYEAYDLEMGRLSCVGDGDTATRASFADGTTSSTQCRGPDACEHANAKGVRCSLHVRLKVQIEGQTDPFSVFELQSSGINTYRTLAAKLTMMYAAFGRLRHVPLELGIYEKSSPLSQYEPFYVADLKLRAGMSIDAAHDQAKKAASEETERGIDSAKMETAAATMAASSPFAVSESDTAIITFTPGIIDHAREPRARARKVGGADSIEQVVARARTDDAELTAPIAAQPIVINNNALEAHEKPPTASQCAASAERPATPI